jgi:hypothetical protein
MSALFWVRLLGLLGQHPAPLPAVRAYYLGHLGKYLPGKAWALVMRATLARAAGVRAGLAGMTALYEVLTTMASGVLLSAVLFGLLGPDTGTAWEPGSLWRLVVAEHRDDAVVDRKVLVLLSLGLLAVVGAPILPSVFNQLVRRLALPFPEPGASPPRLPARALAEGLALTAVGWFLLGASLWVTLRAVTDQAPPLTMASWGRYSAALSLAYVCGFIILLVPSGLGVREFFLTLFLTPDLAAHAGLGEAEARATAVLVVLLLRVVWTAAEMVMAAAVYWQPRAEGTPVAGGEP